MYLCLCNALTDRHVHDAVSAGATRPSEIYRACGCEAQCGSCARTMRRVLDDLAAIGQAGDSMGAD